MRLYASTIFLSAFLLFLVQPIIAKQILPWFGGSASVWATCLVFFQTTLLFGYAYADWSTRSLKPRAQAALHIGLLVLSLVLLPIIPDARWKPGADASGPAMAILALLGATIGLQYFLLSTTSPLVQAWFWRRYHHAVPYRLFALSNFASLLALLAYPVAIEPVLTLVRQSVSWSVAYAVFAVLCAATAIATLRHSTAASSLETAEAAADTSAPPPLRTRLLWVALAAMSSCLLLAVTNHLTQNVPSIPFLWVVPLSLYLITFILCFDHPRWYVRPLFLALAAIMLPVMAWFSESLDLWVAAPLYATGLFILCMVCHGELYRMRPGPRHLTTFYLMIAVGGALGALAIGLGAPFVLHGYYELAITLGLCALLFAWRARGAHALVTAGALGVCVATVGIASYELRDYRRDMRVMVRNFYGVVRTKDFHDPANFRAMYHGAINHGGQFLDPQYRRMPTTYFSTTSAYGRVFETLPPGPRKVGILGLGAGALAAYARRGDTFRFYEIDPQVAAVAVTEFSFLRDAPAQTDIVLGDGRLSLERERPQNYDLLAIDAFAGDSIPMHLITREAMATYLKHIKPDGVIIFQATNRFVDIAPVVERLAAEFGYSALLVSDSPDNGKSAVDYWMSHTDQIIVTRNAALLRADAIRTAAAPLKPRPGFRVWTDDFYNLVHVLKRQNTAID